MRCPGSGNCNGHGKCMNLREVAAYKDDYTYPYANTYTKWDADMMVGCVCDHGYTGYDCSERECNRGQDPVPTVCCMCAFFHYICNVCIHKYQSELLSQATNALSIYIYLCVCM